MGELWWDEQRGIYYRDVVNPKTGNRVRHRFSADEHESLAAYYTLLAKLGRGEPDGGSGRGGRLQAFELVTLFLEWAEQNAAPLTARQYRIYLGWLIDDKAHAYADEVRPLDIERIKAAHAAAGNAPASINHFVTAVKRLYNWAVEQGVLEVNPVQRVKRVRDEAAHQPHDQSPAVVSALTCCGRRLTECRHEKGPVPGIAQGRGFLSSSCPAATQSLWQLAHVTLGLFP